ncbi:SGNH/GDSL hydrolase family protein [Alicyclobacillus fodiniaquatilis]|uniref:SGNH/GDSL hydrolase family protein n=1 Tax=Alicyclobacillus fodiniaquatilis TaxID=1661150 RepID=A0ABW4JJ64_9BACL
MNRKKRWIIVSSSIGTLLVTLGALVGATSEKTPAHVKPPRKQLQASSALTHSTAQAPSKPTKDAGPVNKQIKKAKNLIKHPLHALKAPKIKLHGTIVSLGDSITYGYELPGAKGTTPSPDAYPFLLGNIVHAHVMDLGVPGWTTADLLVALDTKTYQEALHQATLVTVDIGSNDLLHDFNSILASYMEGKEPKSLKPTIAQLKTSVRKLPRQMTTIVQKIRQHTTAPIILATIYDPAPDSTVFQSFANPYIVQANNVIMRVAAQQHTYLFDAYDVINHHQWSLIRLAQIDVHPNIMGQKALAAGFNGVLENKLWNEPTVYAVTQNGAFVYASKNKNGPRIGRIKDVQGYRVLQQWPTWDKIAYGKQIGYVTRSSVHEILRLYRRAVFGKRTVKVQSMTWQTPNKVNIAGLMLGNRLYAPVSALAKIAGRTATWDNRTRTVNIAAGSSLQLGTEPQLRQFGQTGVQKSIQISYLGAAVRIGGELVHLDAEPFSYQGNIYAPVDTLWPQLGGEIDSLDGEFR